ncbi:hypothetical protein [Notoacmeibacter ruber]|uniref:Uncharacterized protein n=1 Tax=Notoacmeibacter ruber TaxID=2670375 RepID=A0A3L7JCA5_9HYPH|nr:hypothetical protein [Notoacmeibacter ruber]RLQ87945.1 hypothetical protein D8780_06735 [Notoacmeibacter ruber]
MKMQHAQSNDHELVQQSPSEKIHDKDAAVSSLRRAARHLAEVGTGKTRTREIVGVLLTHASRSRRVAMPTTAIRLRVQGPKGKPAIGLRV